METLRVSFFAPIVEVVIRPDGSLLGLDEVGRRWTSSSTYSPGRAARTIRQYPEILQTENINLIKGPNGDINGIIRSESKRLWLPIGSPQVTITLEV